MIVYLYDAKTKEYIGEYSPQKNPKNPNAFLYPQNSTILEPKLKDGFVCVFENESWIQKRDYRGKEVINLDTKQVSIVDEIGEIPSGSMLLQEYKNTAEYIKECQIHSVEQNINQIKAKIYELDIKRIRALIEPDLRDDGQTWLEYYNNEIKLLRAKLKEVC